MGGPAGNTFVQCLTAAAYVHATDCAQVHAGLPLLLLRNRTAAQHGTLHCSEASPFAWPIGYLYTAMQGVEITVKFLESPMGIHSLVSLPDHLWA